MNKNDVDGEQKSGAAEKRRREEIRGGAGSLSSDVPATNATRQRDQNNSK